MKGKNYGGDCSKGPNSVSLSHAQTSDSRLITVIALAYEGGPTMEAWIEDVGFAESDSRRMIHVWRPCNPCLLDVGLASIRTRDILVVPFDFVFVGQKNGYFPLALRP